MGRIVVQTFASLDGVIDAPPETAFLPYNDDEVTDEAFALLSSADALLLGRKTFQGLAEAWRSQTGKLADPINAIPKYVLSRTLQNADGWGEASVISYDEVARLRERLNLVMYGCGRLARELASDGLLDAAQIYLAPVVAGGGARLFGEGEELLQLRLGEAREFGAGAIRLTYVSPRG
jgi:dihydrofolate reductase